MQALVQVKTQSQCTIEHKAMCTENLWVVLDTASTTQFVYGCDTPVRMPY